MTPLPLARLRPMSASDLEQVLQWRNHEDVRRFMYTQHHITLIEHTQWFERVSREQGRHLLIFEVQGTPLGFVNLHEIGRGGVADWGFYVAPDAPKGTGTHMGRLTLAHAFGALGLHKLCGQALMHNLRSIKFHLKLGFKQEGILREHHFDGVRFHDIVQFGHLASELQSNILRDHHGHDT